MLPVLLSVKGIERKCILFWCSLNSKHTRSQIIKLYNQPVISIVDWFTYINLSIFSEQIKNENKNSGLSSDRERFVSSESTESEPFEEGFLKISVHYITDQKVNFSMYLFFVFNLMISLVIGVFLGLCDHLNLWEFILRYCNYNNVVELSFFIRLLGRFIQPSRWSCWCAN